MNMIFKRLSLFVIACVIASLFSMASVFAANQIQPDDMDSRIQASSLAIASYQTSHSINDLKAAADWLDGTINIYALTPANFSPRRRTVVRARAQLLKAIEQAYDPTYISSDPKNVVQLGCLRDLPEGATKPMFICNNRDVEALNSLNRAAYIAALQQNNVNIARSNAYSELSSLDMRAMAGLEASLQIFRDVSPTGESSDFVALDGILRQVGISSARRERIDTWFYARPGP